jgi:heterodisulfide reductase subunit B
VRYSFFKGCFIPVRFPHIEKVALQVLPELGIELKKVDGFTCCPEPIGVNLPHRFLGMVVSARNIALAEEAGHDIITICNGCTYSLHQANEQLKHDIDLRCKVNEVLSESSLEFKGKIRVRHFAQILFEDLGLKKIESMVEKPLKGLKVASHTGCHILSPPDVMDFDDPQNPVVMDHMMEALGAESLEYLHKTQCCGWTLSNFGDRAFANKLLRDKLEAMHQVGADCINVICPQCLAQLDTGQTLAVRSEKLDFKLPALFYIQYLALAMGYSLEDVGYSNHRVKNEGFEKKMEDILA